MWEKPSLWIEAEPSVGYILNPLSRNGRHRLSGTARLFSISFVMDGWCEPAGDHNWQYDMSSEIRMKSRFEVLLTTKIEEPDCRYTYHKQRPRTLPILHSEELNFVSADI